LDDFLGEGGGRTKYVMIRKGRRIERYICLRAVDGQGIRNRGGFVVGRRGELTKKSRTKIPWR
jgi:hypothetical protein